MLMGIAHHPGHARKSGDFLRSALGIAARDDDLCRWIFAMDTANGGAGVLVCCGGDSTGIEYDHLGLSGGVRRCKALIGQLALQGRSIRLGGAAAETLDKKTGHEGYYNGDIRSTTRCSSSQPIQMLAASY